MGHSYTTVSVVFPGFHATAGPGVSPADSKKSCQLSVGVRIPPGFSFGIKAIGYRGLYQLSDKVTATQKAIYYFQGHPEQATASSVFTGPVRGEEYLNILTFSAPLRSPCGGSTVLSLSNSINIDNNANKQGGGYISVGSLKLGENQTYAFDWVKC
ncbi:hypothetical protein FRC14_001137 [Serendipita sp. 396]|nr:hypothetical protein FRC14_001137 [Serendipita sp. 396]